VDSNMLVQNKSSDDFTVIRKGGKIAKYLNKLMPIFDKLPLRFYPKRSKDLFSPSWIKFGDIVKQIDRINPDIVHLHGGGGGRMGIEDFARITQPIIWSLHDMWAFTGGCHYSGNCQGFLSGCGNCVFLNSGKERDLSRKVFSRKRKAFSQKDNMAIVGVSDWISHCSENSYLLKGKKHVCLPNLINTSMFKPCEAVFSRKLWNLPQGRKLILYGAIGATSDPRKGFKELGSAIRKLKSTNVELVVFGSGLPEHAPNFEFKVHYLGSLSDIASLVTLYSAVDVMVVPSKQEAFGQTASEAMACGTPVVAFRTTGLLDIVNHKENGYLAKSFDVDDLAFGIDWVLNHEDSNKISRNARDKVLSTFDSNLVARKYINLYQEMR